MGDFLVEMIFSGLLFFLHEKNRVLYTVAMGCILVVCGGIAIFFYTAGAPVKGTFMAVFTLLMLILLLYSIRKAPKSSRPAWNSWFANRR